MKRSENKERVCYMPQTKKSPSIICLDVESYYSKKDYSLSKLCTEEYIRDSNFEVIGVSVKVGKGETQWFSGDFKETRKWLSQFPWSESLALSHNAHFDMAIMLWHYGIRPKGFLDTLSMANPLHGVNESVSLANLAKLYGLPAKGTAVHDADGKRRKDFTSQELAEYGEYCKHDTELCRMLFDRMAPFFSREEFRLIDLTIRMFVEPVLVLNQPLLETHLYRTREEQQKSLLTLKKMLMHDEGSTEEDQLEAAMSSTDELKKVLRSNPKFATLLRKLKVDPPMKISPTTGKETYAFAKTDEKFAELLEHENLLVQTAVAARLGNKTTIEESRTQTFIGVAKRGAFPFPIKYSGAQVSHRWSGFDYNVQNMGKVSKLRESICAPKGFKIVVADLSNIELRLGLYMACQDDKVKLIDDGVDMYIDIATSIFNKSYGEIADLGRKSRERTTGKVVQLSSIYGTGHVKLKDTLRVQGKVRFSLEETQAMTDLYRGEYDMVVKAWGHGMDVLDNLYAGEAYGEYLRPGILQVTTEGIVKPSGLVLTYPDLRWSRDRDGKMGYSYAQRCNLRDRVYGSKVYQRCIQSLARDIIAEHMLKIDKMYWVAGTVHDEVICVVAENEIEQAQEFILEVMRTPPVWAPTLPLDAELWFSDNYGGEK